MTKSPKPRKKRKWLTYCSWSIAAIVVAWFLGNWIALHRASKSDLDAFLVLGGSIRREVYVANFEKQYPEVPVLISAGSPPPCILSVFERSQTPIEKVWLENCARSTFGNFFFSLPILESWNAKKVMLITSPTHLPRARWLAQIILGSHGIWVETYAVTEKGIPANTESTLKTILDVVRSSAWTIVSQFYSPSCPKLTALADVKMEEWSDRDFNCEYQYDLQVKTLGQPLRGIKN